MALSDQLFGLSNRAKEAEQRGTAARDKANAQLEQDVQAAEQKARARADELSRKTNAGKNKVSDFWDDQQKRWNKTVNEAREHMHEKRDERDLHNAQKTADRAETDASFAVEYAYAAIEEAEYEVLDALLLRKQADQLAASGTT